MEGGVYGIVIVISAFMIQALTFGTASSIGVYNVELLDFFGDSSTVGVSLIGSINLGLYMGSGPIVSFMMTKFSHRKIALFGSVLVVVGLLGMPMLPYIPTMCLFFGVLTGFGSSCTYIPSHVLSGLYYERYRSLATGITTSGSGLGSAFMPVLTGFLIDLYGWRGSFIFVAGLNLHLFIFTALLRDPPTDTNTKAIGQELKDVSTTHEDDVSVTSGLNQDEKKNLVKQNKHSSRGALSSDAVAKTAMDVSFTESNYDNFGVDLSSLDYIDKISIKTDKNSIDSFSKLAPMSRPILPRLMMTSTSSTQSTGSVFHGEHGSKLANRSNENSIYLGDDKSFNFWGLLYPSASTNSLFAVGSRASSVIFLEDHVNTNTNIQETSHRSITPIPESESYSPPLSSRHVYIFTNYGFDIYFLSNIMWNAGFAIVQTFAPEYLIQEKELSLIEAAWLSGAFGCACFLGGILGGVLGNIDFINRNGLYISANLTMGVATLLFPVCEHIALYTSCLVVSGFSFGVILGLLIVVLTDIIGIESLGNGLGYLMLSNGLGTFIGPLAASSLKEATGHFTSSMLLAGTFCIIGGLIMLLMPQGLQCLRPGKDQTPTHGFQDDDSKIVSL